jgi:acyl-CoA reductase-like NAD-dependent aldehyde dehydrogenase
VHDYIRAGIAEGARLLTGGPDAPDGLDRGYFVRPTVFSGDNNMRIAQEEIFGPVVVIIPFDDEDDAVRIANDTVYGLAGAVWAADPDRARRIAGRVRTGRIRINGAPSGQPRPTRWVQALRSWPGMGPLRHRGVPRRPVDHRLTSLTSGLMAVWRQRGRAPWEIRSSGTGSLARRINENP